jgi:putative SbcD/Mre11-related phosphoesterase
MQFIYNAPAIIHKGALIIGDTHFGMERRLRERGISSNDFSMRLVEKIISISKEHKIKKLFLLGDVKDDIAYVDAFTREAVNELINAKLDISVVRGNHDGGIEEFESKIKIFPAEGLVYEKLALIHGHSWPSEECMNSEYLIAAHQHPQMQFIDSSGKKHIEPVWLIAEPNEKIISEHFDSFNKKIKLVMLPAFNPLVGTVIKTDVFSVLGPVLNNKLFKWNDALVYRLNGVAVGKLSDIEVTR